MYRTFGLPRAVRHNPAIDAWLGAQSVELGSIARHWFDLTRSCGTDVNNGPGSYPERLNVGRKVVPKCSAR